MNLQRKRDFLGDLPGRKRDALSGLPGRKRDALGDLPGRKVEAMRSFAGPWLDYFQPQGDSPQADSDRRAEITYTLWNLRMLARRVMGGSGTGDVADALNFIAARGPEVEQAIVVWLNLLEVLVQDTEQRFGSQPGRGPLKQDQVQGILRYFLRTDRLDLGIPSIPRYLMPVIIDVVATWALDGLVLVLNENALWVPAPPKAQSLHARLVIALRPIARFLAPVGNGLALAINRAWFALHVQAPLSPAIRSALDAIAQQGVVRTNRPFLAEVFDLVAWIGHHRDQLVAGVQLVFAAVQEAESYLELSGPEKKAFAHDLVLAVLDQLGFEARAGLLFALVESSINGSIESAVSIFNRRGAFTHRSTTPAVA